MFEKLFNIKKVETSANYALFGGVFFTILSFITSYLIFKRTVGFVGVASILFTVLLSMPIVLKFLELTNITEKRSFFSRTKHLFDFYIYFFIGSFVVFFLVSLAFPSLVLSSEQLFGSTTKLILPQKAGLPPPPVNEFSLAVSIFKNNLYVTLISFVLSLLYGAGSLFLLTLNASIFASTLSYVIRDTALTTNYIGLFALFSCNMGVLFFHMIPEVIAYLLAAIAGGLLSVIVVREKLFSPSFMKASNYTLLALLAAVGILLIGALIEVYVSRQLLLTGTCSKNIAGVLFAAAAIVAAVAVLEFRRKRI